MAAMPERKLSKMLCTTFGKYSRVLQLEKEKLRFLHRKNCSSGAATSSMSIFFQTVFTRRTIIFLDLIFHCARCAMKDKKVINCLESKVIHCVDAPFGLGNPYAIFRGGFQKLFRK